MHAEPIRFVHLPSQVLTAAKQCAVEAIPTYTPLTRAHAAARVRKALERGYLTAKEVAQAAGSGPVGADGRFTTLGRKLQQRMRRRLHKPALPPTLSPPLDPVFEVPAARESLKVWSIALVRCGALTPEAALDALAKGGRELAERLVSACTDYYRVEFERMPEAIRGAWIAEAYQQLWTVAPACLYPAIMGDYPAAVVMEPDTAADNCGLTLDRLNLTLDSPDVDVIAKAIQALASTTTVLHITPPHWILDDAWCNSMLAEDIAVYVAESLRPDGTPFVPDALLEQVEMEYGWERTDPHTTEMLLDALRFMRERHAHFDGRETLASAANKLRQHTDTAQPEPRRTAALMGLAALLDWAQATRPRALKRSEMGLTVEPMDEEQGACGLHVVAANLCGLEEGFIADMQDMQMQCGSGGAVIATADNLANLFHLCVRDACVITALSNLLTAYNEAVE